MTINSVYTACAIAEGWDGKQHTQDTELKAWAYLIKSGACWQLQGWYGRNAAHLIDCGLISKTGRVQWKNIK